MLSEMAPVSRQMALLSSHESLRGTGAGEIARPEQEYSGAVMGDFRQVEGVPLVRSPAGKSSESRGFDPEANRQSLGSRPSRNGTLKSAFPVTRPPLGRKSLISLICRQVHRLTPTSHQLAVGSGIANTHGSPLEA